MKYIVKIIERISYNEYKSIILKEFDNLESANNYCEDIQGAFVEIKK